MAVPCNDAAFRAQDEELYVTKTAVSNASGGGGAPATLLLDLQRARRALGGYLAAHPPCAEDLLPDRRHRADGTRRARRGDRGPRGQGGCGVAPHQGARLAAVGAERAARRTIGFRARFRGSRKRPGMPIFPGWSPCPPRSPIRLRSTCRASSARAPRRSLPRRRRRARWTCSTGLSGHCTTSSEAPVWRRSCSSTAGCGRSGSAATR